VLAVEAGDHEHVAASGGDQLGKLGASVFAPDAFSDRCCRSGASDRQLDGDIMVSRRDPGIAVNRHAVSILNILGEDIIYCEIKVNIYIVNHNFE